MHDTYLIIQTLGFTTGAALFGMLTVLSRKAERLSGEKNYGAEAAALGLLWNLGMLIEYAARLGGATMNSLPMRLVGAVAYTSLAWLPTAMFLSQLERRMSPPTRRLKKWLTGCSLAAATALTIVLFASALTSQRSFMSNKLLNLVAYNLIVHLIAIAVLIARAGSKPELRSYGRAEFLLLAGLAALLLALIHFALDASWETAIKVLAQQTGIPFALAAFASFSRFQFADVFVKRSFLIIASVVTALVYSFFVISPILRFVRASARYPQAASWIVVTLLGCALLLVFPTLKEVIYRATDRVLFRRPAYSKLLQIFAQESDQAENERRLFAIAEDHARSALQAERVAVLPHTEPMPGELSGVKIERSLPVQTRGAITHLLAIAPGKASRKLLSDELSFLSSIVERIGRRLEALQFERERRERELRETRLRHSLTEAELRALQAQINPHFLFNTLNTIADLIGSEPEKAELMIERLAEVFRYALARTETSSISVAEEFDFLRTYLAIEQTRFGERLSVEMEIDPAAATVQIPPLILQPLVENAVKHGIAPKREGGRLSIRAFSENDRLLLVVEDDGVGWNEEFSGNGVGLRNVRERLQTFYETCARLEIHSAPDRGTRVSIEIPNYEAQNTDRGRRSLGALAAEEAHRRAS